MEDTYKEAPNTFQAMLLPATPVPFSVLWKSRPLSAASFNFDTLFRELKR